MPWRMAEWLEHRFASQWGRGVTGRRWGSAFVSRFRSRRHNGGRGVATRVCFEEGFERREWVQQSPVERTDDEKVRVGERMQGLSDEPMGAMCAGCG